jgi:hypothetical protein
MPDEPFAVIVASYLYTVIRLPLFRSFSDLIIEWNSRCRSVLPNMLPHVRLRRPVRGLLTARPCSRRGGALAVKTTGIHCRPVCWARTPFARNLESYPSAAAAERGGYRPCFRCRPETAPFCPAWEGTKTTVERALVLISAEPFLTLRKQRWLLQSLY